MIVARVTVSMVMGVVRVVIMAVVRVVIMAVMRVVIMGVMRVVIMGVVICVLMVFVITASHGASVLSGRTLSPHYSTKYSVLEVPFNYPASFGLDTKHSCRSSA